MQETYYSHGKLLLTGEYVVLDGATALAIPTRLGQSLQVQEGGAEFLQWTSMDLNGKVWFQAQLDQQLQVISSSDMKIATTLRTILSEARKGNDKFLVNNSLHTVKTQLEFPQNWGLGSSSTLINNVAQWANVDAFQLLEQSFGGSGYDIAAAQRDTPIFYTRNTPEPIVKNIALPWDFKEELFFVHLNLKQDSKVGIARYHTKTVASLDFQRITDISRKLLLCYSLSDFINLMNHHEEIISRIIQLPTVKERLFSDYSGAIKSLGAWGGDFVLATGTASDQDYFRRKGYETILPFSEMIA